MASGYAITFFYYDKLEAAARFYEDVLEFELVLDQGMARIYRVAAQSYFGIVDGNKGHLRHQLKSAALLTIVVDDVSAWHASLVAKGVDSCSQIQWGTYCEHFFFEDPAGYAIEIQRFHDPAVAQLFAQ
ncbi:MAG: bleomycin resistance protein [Chromatiales bacterium]|jgi:catechol 2,3-dioxygenase-like lactoylglutathione lyase family enzyme|nr:bleomycin resistance protein [Chromatiales bacterium]